MCVLGVYVCTCMYSNNIMGNGVRNNQQAGLVKSYVGFLTNFPARETEVMTKITK